MLASLARVLTYAVKDFARNIWLSVTTVLILTLTLVSVQVLLAVNVAGRIALDALESRIDLRVQFLPSVSEADVDALRLTLEERSEVTSVIHVARAQVLQDFQDAHVGDAQVLDALAELGENPFGPELRIHVRNPEEFPIVVKALDGPAFTNRVVETSAADRLVLVEQLNALTGKLRLAGIGLSGISFLVTLLIIINAMRIATYARREEVGIMKLVGATNWFVRTPFLIMGVLAAAIGTAFAQLLSIPTLRAIEPTIVSFLGERGIEVRGFFEQYIWEIAGAEFLGLALLSTLVSAFAIRRYLRV